MKFFDSLINDVQSCVSQFSQTAYPFDVTKSVNDTGYSQVILQRDTAFELNGVGVSLVTSSDIGDGIIVVGDDLCKIGDNRKFARISLVQTDDVEDEQKAYNLIRKIEYVKYHVFPEGYMIRTASSSQNESVRVEKSALKDGISFENIGNLMINKYKEIEAVRGVKIIFVTVPDVDYDSFFRIAEKCNDITKTLNHVLNAVNFDCDTCSLKAVCDEVEGIRKLHFRNKERNM